MQWKAFACASRQTVWTLVALLTTIPSLFAVAQVAAVHRPPSVPLFTNDPFFSVWSMGDRLTESVTKHWSEAPEPMTGLARIDGKS